jgi:hypothetical protein
MFQKTMLKTQNKIEILIAKISEPPFIKEKIKKRIDNININKNS